MNKGFSIEIQQDFSSEDEQSAKDFAKDFVTKTVGNDMNFWLKGGGGHRSFLRRGRFGFRFNKSKDMVFRRISNNTRRFAIVKANTLINKDTGTNMAFAKGCVCQKCLGATKVRWVYKPETYIYATIGDIKG